MRRSVGVRISETELGPSRRWRAFLQSTLSLATARIRSRRGWTHKWAQARTGAASSAYRDTAGVSLLWPPEDAGLMAVQAQQVGLRWWQFLECRPRG